MKCKQCLKELVMTETGWMHVTHEVVPCYRKQCQTTIAEPAEEWVTPTSGPVLPEVEVSNNGIDWIKAKLIRVTDEGEYNYPFIVAFEMPDTYMHAYAQCRMRKDE